MSALSVVDDRERIWMEHLAVVFKNLDIPSDTLSDNLAASVALYCRSYHPRGLQAPELNLLVARAFCAVGDLEAAARVLGSMKMLERHVDRWCEILTELHHFPDLLPYFARRIIRPADWAGAQLDRMWVLDFGRLVLTDLERHEITLYRSIRVLIEKIAVFWDPTDGEGVLGLKALSVLDVGGAGDPASGMKKNNWMQYIESLFGQEKRQREWREVPFLLNLDLSD